jgi:hypothetical protein
MQPMCRSKRFMRSGQHERIAAHKPRFTIRRRDIAIRAPVSPRRLISAKVRWGS